MTQANGCMLCNKFSLHTSPNLVTGEKRPGRTGKDKTGQDRTGQDRTKQNRTWQDRTRQDGMGWDRRKKTASNVTQRLTVFTAALVRTKQNSFKFFITIFHIFLLSFHYSLGNSNNCFLSVHVFLLVMVGGLGLFLFFFNLYTWQGHWMNLCFLN